MIQHSSEVRPHDAVHYQHHVSHTITSSQLACYVSVQLQCCISRTLQVRVPTIGPEQLGIIPVSNPDGEDLQV